MMSFSRNRCNKSLNKCILYCCCVLKFLCSLMKKNISFSSRFCLLVRLFSSFFLSFLCIAPTMDENPKVWKLMACNNLSKMLIHTKNYETSNKNEKCLTAFRPVIKNNFTVWMRQSLIQGGFEICQAVSFALFLAFLAP